MRGRSRHLSRSFPPARDRSRCATLLAFTGVVVAGCVDLQVTNVNEPDSERALSNPGDAGALISASFNSWFGGVYGVPGVTQPGTAGMFLSNQAFQHAAPYKNWGMYLYGKLPRAGIRNDVLDPEYETVSFIWEGCYQALSALSTGLKALGDPEVAGAIEEQTEIPGEAYRAFGRFVQGLAHGTVALVYDRGIVVDEGTNLDEPQTPVPYADLMERALAYFDAAISIAASNSFALPFDWMQADVDSQALIRLAHSYEARFRAQVARTPEEREGVAWNAVVADVDAGIQTTHTLEMDWDAGWMNGFLRFSTDWRMGQLPYFIYGMADQSGDVAEWYALPLAEKRERLPDGRPVLIVTPDLRFPQGSTVEEQRANAGRYFRIILPIEEAGVNSSWWHPERGTWRWSWYKASYNRGLDYWGFKTKDQPEITLAEMRLLKAEGLYRTGDLAEAAAIVNETRVAAGLNPTDLSGTNTSCVPRLPDGSCGNLWEMLKWEKRMEMVWTGIAGVGWFFDGRGWGDLWRDTPLQLPVPCLEMELLGVESCDSFGGPGGQMGSPGSTYDFPFERTAAR